MSTQKTPEQIGIDAANIDFVIANISDYIEFKRLQTDHMLAQAAYWRRVDELKKGFE
jgi:hypothetical protein